MAEYLDNSLSWFLGVLALLSALRTLFIYARDRRYSNIDQMGLSIKFQYRWLMAALLAGFAVGTINSLLWIWGLVAGVMLFSTTFLLRRLVASIMKPFGWRSLIDGETSGSFKNLDHKADELADNSENSGTREC